MWPGSRGLVFKFSHHILIPTILSYCPSCGWKALLKAFFFFGGWWIKSLIKSKAGLIECERNLCPNEYAKRCSGLKFLTPGPRCPFQLIFRPAEVKDVQPGPERVLPVSQEFLISAIPAEDYGANYLDTFSLSRRDHQLFRSTCADSWIIHFLFTAGDRCVTSVMSAQGVWEK